MDLKKEENIGLLVEDEVNNVHAMETLVCQEPPESVHFVELIVPLVRQARHYSWSFLIIAGVSVAAVSIPQALAYAALASLPPVYGLYACILPVIIYSLFGTSKHLSVGPFALSSLLVQRALSSSGLSTEEYNEAVMSITCLIGIVQITLCLLRFGRIANYISEFVIEGFTTAASIQIITSQIPSLLGIEIPKIEGYASSLIQWYYIFARISNTSAMSFCLGVASIALLFFTRHINKTKGYKIPIPDVIILLFTGAIIFKFVNTNLELVGFIPKGLLAPKLPNFKVFGKSWFSLSLDCGIIAIVSFLLSFSVAKQFALKLNYAQEIQSSHDLFVFGIVNVLGSIFHCYVACASLSRSSILVSTGGQTNFASLTSTFLILLTLLFFADFFSSVPLTMLAAVIIVALWGTFSQIFQLKKLVQSRNFKTISEWVITFVSVMCLDITLGIMIGCGFSLFYYLINDLLINSAFYPIGVTKAGSFKRIFKLNVYQAETLNDIFIVHVNRLDSSSYHSLLLYLDRFDFKDLIVECCNIDTLSSLQSYCESKEKELIIVDRDSVCVIENVESFVSISSAVQYCENKHAV